MGHFSGLLLVAQGIGLAQSESVASFTDCRPYMGQDCRRWSPLVSEGKPDMPGAYSSLSGNLLDSKAAQAKRGFESSIVEID